MEKPASPDKIAHRTRFASRKDSVSEPAPPKRKPSDYIAPPLRRLGQYLHLSHVVPSEQITGPVDFGLQKAVALVVRSSKPNVGYSGEFLHELTNLASEYMGLLFRLLHELTEVQRHHRPGIADLEMCLVQHRLSASDLGHEYDRAVPAEIKAHSAALSDQMDAMLREYYAENYHLEKDDPSLVFHANEQYEVAALVPRQSKERTYIPSYLPDLPPDFTYQYTGNYMKTLTDLKEIKLKLVDESRLNEASLYKLIDDESKAWSVTDVESDADDIMSEVEAVSEVESPMQEREELYKLDKLDKLDESDKLDKLDKLPDGSSAEIAVQGAPPTDIAPKPDKKFDFVAYARSRSLAKQRQAREIELRRQKRNKNVFMCAERVFSCYADTPSAANREYIQKTLQRGFKKVINATRRAEQEKKKRITELLALKAKAEQEHEQNNAIEFGFAFNHASNLSDSDDDDDDEPKEFDFGDHEFDFGDGETGERKAREGEAGEGEAGEGEALDGEAKENSGSKDEESTAGRAQAELGDTEVFGDDIFDLPQTSHVLDNTTGTGMVSELDSSLRAAHSPHPETVLNEPQWKTEEQDDSDEDELEDL